MKTYTVFKISRTEIKNNLRKRRLPQVADKNFGSFT